jgi:hypothetical protein
MRNPVEPFLKQGKRFVISSIKKKRVWPNPSKTVTPSTHRPVLADHHGTWRVHTATLTTHTRCTRTTETKIFVEIASQDCRRELFFFVFVGCICISRQACRWMEPCETSVNAEVTMHISAYIWDSNKILVVVKAAAGRVGRFCALGPIAQVVEPQRRPCKCIHIPAGVIPAGTFFSRFGPIS